MWSALCAAWHRLTASIRWRRLERDLDDELTFHLAMQQRREIGIRMALGASPGTVVRLLFTHYARALLAGLTLGLGGSIAASIVLRHRLHGLSPFDPVAYLAVAAVLACAGVLATFVPARAAIRVNPSHTLREI